MRWKMLTGIVAVAVACGGVVPRADDAAPIDALETADATTDAGWPDAQPSDAEPPDDAASCPSVITQPPPCVTCCQMFVQESPGSPICPVCRITVTITGAWTERPGSCEADQPCCADVYEGLCP